jgi:DNA-binding response OmpR family regulator
MTRILITDDDPDFVEILTMILKKEGYQIDCAANGNEALAKMRA